MKRSMLHALALMMLFLHPILHAQSGTLCGTVTGYRGAPMSDAVVRLSDSTFFRSAWLADSTFTIPDIAPGDYTLDISAPGFIPERYEMTILAGQRARIAMTLLPAAPRSVPPVPVVTPHAGRVGEKISITPDDVQRSARASIRSAMLLNSGVTTAGVNGIRIQCQGKVWLIPTYEVIEPARAADTAATDGVIVIDSKFDDSYTTPPVEPRDPVESITATPPATPGPDRMGVAPPLLR